MEKNKKNINEKKITRRNSLGQFIKGNYSWSNSLKGKTYDEIYGKEKSNNIKKIIGLRGKNRIFSQTHKDNISKAKKGISWNEMYGIEKANILRKNKINQLLGKSYIDHFGIEKAKQIIDKKRAKMVGHETSKETRDKIKHGNNAFILNNGHPLKGKTYEQIYGKDRARNVINKKSGENHWNKGGTISEWHKEILRRSRSKQIFPLKDTSIEIKIQEFLKKLYPEFYTHQYISNIFHAYQCDIFIPNLNLIIECFGDYWHANSDKYDFNQLNEEQKDQQLEDELRAYELINKGYNLLILWENEIRKMNMNDFKTLLDKYIKNKQTSSFIEVGRVLK
jgi:G:T-mismatch repair DNA endonuclease (very short patch repair protein)